MSGGYIGEKPETEKATDNISETRTKVWKATFLLVTEISSSDVLL